jgi:hypothetical protein
VEFIEDVGRKARIKVPQERPTHNWVHDIGMAFGEIGWGGMSWIWLRRGISEGLL